MFNFYLGEFTVKSPPRKKQEVHSQTTVCWSDYIFIPISVFFEDLKTVMKRY